MAAMKLVSLVAAAALALSACGADESDTAQPSEPQTSDSDWDRTEPATQPTATIPPPDDGSPPPDGDVAPGPDGAVPPEVIPFGSAAYRSTFVEGEFEPFQWAPSLVAVECGATAAPALNEEYRAEIVDPLILRVGEEICTATVSYENIGTIPGRPTPPSGVVVGNGLYGEGDPALVTINDLMVEEALGGLLEPGQSVEIDTHLVAPSRSQIESIYFGPDASLIEVWLATD